MSSNPAFWSNSPVDAATASAWEQSLRLACRWIVDRAMIRTPEHDMPHSRYFWLHVYRDWRGALRGEYAAATRQWDVFCPVWHTGQAVKALAMAAKALDAPELLAAARDAADFILRNQVSDSAAAEYGMIRAYEHGNRGGINTSAVLESLDGLLVLSQVSGDERYQDAAIAALQWVRQRLFIPERGLFHDAYDERAGKVSQADWSIGGRPLLDDGVFFKGYELTGDERLLDVGRRVADRLLLDEDPPGNWIKYPPARSGRIHPRHAYWWGRPLWMAYRAMGEERYLDACRRSAQWYVQAMRTDGGFFRTTDEQFRTASFGHATSGTACAVILWHDLVSQFGDEQWTEPLRRGIRYCRSMQFTRAADPNLQGAILEKVNRPDGSDAPTWYLRDLGTIFYVQAVAAMLMASPALLLED